MFLGEIIAGVFGQAIGEGILHGVVYLLRAVGALVFSAFSFFRVPASEHYATESFDKKVGLFWTGLVTVGLIVWGLWWLIGVFKANWY